MTMKKILTISLIIFFAVSGGLANAQSAAVQNALEDVKGQVQNLVTAKDEGKTTDLNLRIETFKKVLDFSISEAKDLKVKLLALDKLSAETALWRDNVVKTVSAALDYYESQKQKIEYADVITLETITKMASDFKEWREKNYLPAAGGADSYLLIVQEQKAVEVAEKRWQRIQKDILALQKARVKNAGQLKGMLDEAGKKISEAKKINEEAGGLFWDNYLAPYALMLTENQTSTTSSIPKMGTTTLELATTSTSSAEANATSSPVFQPSSIKDMVESSLNQIKEAYQIFIEMSNLVRKLLS